MCKVRGCKRKATQTWALVPVCKEYRTALMVEARRFYSERITRNERKVLNSIQHLTVWGRKEQRIGGHWQ